MDMRDGDKVVAVEPIMNEAQEVEPSTSPEASSEIPSGPYEGDDGGDP